MAFEKPDKGLRRVIFHLRRVCRPNGSTDGQQMVVDEAPTVIAVTQEIAQSQLACRVIVQKGRRLFVESQHVAHHPPEAGSRNVGALAEQAVQIRPGVFECAVAERGGKGHVAGLRRHVQVIKQRDQIRIASFVVDNEASVDGCFVLAVRDVHGVRMTADPIILLIDGDVVALVEQPSR